MIRISQSKVIYVLQQNAARVSCFCFFPFPICAQMKRLYPKTIKTVADSLFDTFQPVSHIEFLNTVRIFRQITELYMLHLWSIILISFTISGIHYMNYFIDNIFAEV